MPVQGTAWSKCPRGMGEWMGGQTDVVGCWMDRLNDGWTNGWMDVGVDGGQMNVGRDGRWTGRMMDGQMDGWDWMGGQMAVELDVGWTDGWMWVWMMDRQI